MLELLLKTSMVSMGIILGGIAAFFIFVLILYVISFLFGGLVILFKR